MVEKISPLDEITKCLMSRISFVLQGGAGSGKTETLKQTLEFVLRQYPQARIACITHTNLAVDEIKNRIDIGDKNVISTIHSFLNFLIHDYKVNIHSVLPELFKVPLIVRENDDGSSDYKKKEHENYKKIHKKLSSTLFRLKRETIEKAASKKEYEKAPESFNADLNTMVASLNHFIVNKISEQDSRLVNYNETSFDNLEELSYGHDGLIVVASLLFKKYPSLGKIVQDSFDFIFIDEYQDTNEAIIEIFLKILPEANKTTVGLFGDSMQAIYEDGIGDVENYVSAGILKKIEKEDNYRCSEQVIEFINKFRSDGLKQSLGFKRIDGGDFETRAERQGEVKLFYSLYENKPSAFSEASEKEAYQLKLDSLISAACEGVSFDVKKLMLTNKAISTKVGFENLFQIFSDRYMDPKDHIERALDRLQITELCKLIQLYEARSYNAIFSSLKKLGFSLKKLEDKILLQEKFRQIVSSNESLIETLELAFSLQLIKKSESCKAYFDAREKLLNELSKDSKYLEFKVKFDQGLNTFTRMLAADPLLVEEDFDEQKKNIQREKFFTDLFSKKIKFKEALTYLKYMDENTDYTTMHKTKGASIENVVVVLDEFLWSQYKFGTLFGVESDNEKIKLRSQKLMYVACSRTKRNLSCVRLVSSIEEPLLERFFPQRIKVE